LKQGFLARINDNWKYGAQTESHLINSHWMGIAKGPPAKVGEAVSKPAAPILMLPTLANFAQASIDA